VISTGTVSRLYEFNAITDHRGVTLGYRLVRASDHTAYDIDAENWECSCPDSVYRQKECKHAGAVKAGLRAIGQLPASKGGL
jgi:hypothetical protein